MAAESEVDTLVALGRAEEALPRAEAVLEARLTVSRASDPTLSHGYATLARPLVVLGRHAEAIPVLEKCLALPNLQTEVPLMLARCRAMLGVSLWVHERSRARARELLAAARQQFEDPAARDEEWLAEIAAVEAELGDPGR
jgi:tetratricopeptide (TPR) repeat protein